MSSKGAEGMVVPRREGKFVYVPDKSGIGVDIIDVILDGKEEELDFPEYLGGHYASCISLRNCGKVFNGIKKVSLSKKVREFLVKNSQFPDLERFFGPNAASVDNLTCGSRFPKQAFLFDWKTKTLFNNIDTIATCIINVFDTESTGTYEDPCIRRGNSGLKNIGDYAFEDTKFSDIVIGGRLDDISEKAFDGSRFKELGENKPIFTIKAPEGDFVLGVQNNPVINIFDLAKLRTSISDIGAQPFGAITVEIGQDIPTNFMSCRIRKSVRTIRIKKGFRLTVRTARFLSNFQRTKNIEADEDAGFCVVDGVLFSKNKKMLIYYPPERPGVEYRIPDGTERVFSFAFRRSEYLRKVSFPDTCKIFDKGAFSQEQFDELTIPSGLLDSDEQWIENSRINKLIIAQKAVAQIPTSYNRIFCTVVEDGVQYIGKYGLRCEDRDYYTGTHRDLDVDTSPAEIVLPASVKAISANAIRYGGIHGGHIINIKAYSHTLNLALAAFNSMTNALNSLAYVSINLIDKGGMIPMCSSMSKESVEAINSDLSSEKSYAEVLDEALGAIKAACARCDIASSMLPDAKGDVKEVLERHLRKGSSYYAKRLMETKDVDGLIKLVSYDLCTQKTIEYILSKADNDTMPELVALVSERTKKRTKRLSI